MSYEKIDAGDEKDKFYSLLLKIVDYYQQDPQDISTRLEIERMIKGQFRKDHPDWVLNLVLEAIRLYDSNGYRREEKAAEQSSQ
jgi:hypothetical protein